MPSKRKKASVPKAKRPSTPRDPADKGGRPPHPMRETAISEAQILLQGGGEINRSAIARKYRVAVATANEWAKEALQRHSGVPRAKTPPDIDSSASELASKTLGPSDKQIKAAARKKAQVALMGLPAPVTRRSSQYVGSLLSDRSWEGELSRLLSDAEKVRRLSIEIDPETGEEALIPAGVNIMDRSIVLRLGVYEAIQKVAKQLYDLAAIERFQRRIEGIILHVLKDHPDLQAAAIDQIEREASRRNMGPYDPGDADG